MDKKFGDENPMSTSKGESSPKSGNESATPMHQNTPITLDEKTDDEGSVLSSLCRDVWFAQHVLAKW